MGSLDAAALAAELARDLDQGAALLASLSRATDRALREAARALAPRLLLPAAPATTVRSARAGAAKLEPSGPEGLDVDYEATLERLGDRPRLMAGDLRFRDWRRPGRAYVLVLDASGSVAGAPLATALVTAAALASRIGPGDELAVVAFWSKQVVLRHLRSPLPPASVIDAVLDLRGGDTTDLAGALASGLRQAALARSPVRDLLLLSDGLANEGGDPLPVARSASASGATLHVLALSAEEKALSACAALADAGGGRLAPLTRPSQAQHALATVLG